MKQIKFALLAFCIVLSAASCKRDYICRCTYGVAKNGYDIQFQNINYGKAKNDCNKYSSTSKSVDAPKCELLVD